MAIGQATSEEEARRVFQDRVGTARREQVRLHYVCARNLAKDLGVKADKDGLPGMAVPEEGQVLDALNQIAAGCLSKADRYRREGDKPDLRNANRTVIDIRGALAEAMDYYARLG